MDDFNKPTDDTWKPNILCSTCKTQISNWNLAGPTIPYGRKDRRTLHDIQTSSLNGCHLCSILAHHLYPVHKPSDVTPSSDPRYVVMTLNHTKSTSKEVKHIVNLALYNPTDPESEAIQTILFIDTVPFIPYHPSSAGFSVSTGSKLMLDLAREWLRDCEQNHPDCAKFASTPVSKTMPKAPSHLVQITPSSPPTVRLVETANLSPCPHWATLSHCWGPHPIFSTTESNLSQNLIAIPLSSLPQTFIDAINITLSLGYTHIWIDSLCIIQDSQAHWRQESAIMGNVYRGSAFTIAAAGAADGTQGCFRRRNPLGWHTMRMDLPVPDRTGETTPVWFYADTPESKHDWSSTTPDGYSPTGPVTIEPLHTRGWVVQERLLSPRTIFFGSWGMTFECVSVVGSDTRDKFSIINDTAKKTLWELNTQVPEGPLKDSGQWKDFHGYWWKVIKMYTGCQLTRETDRLVAIGGIIAAMETITGFENIAGLWRETFLSDLLWNQDKPAKRRKNEGGYRAPTWSWASREGPALNTQDIGMYNRIWKAKLVDAGVTGKAANRQIKGGWARLEGELRKVRWVKEEDEYYGGWNYRIVWSSGGEGDEEEHEEGMAFTPDVMMEEEEGEFWLLRVLKCNGSHSWMNLGLAVMKNGKKNDKGEEEWERMGSFRQYEWAQTKDTLFEGRVVPEEGELYIV